VGRGNGEGARAELTGPNCASIGPTCRSIHLFSSLIVSYRNQLAVDWLRPRLAAITPRQDGGMHSESLLEVLKAMSSTVVREASVSLPLRGSCMTAARRSRMSRGRARSLPPDATPHSPSCLHFLSAAAGTIPLAVGSTLRCAVVAWYAVTRSPRGKCQGAGSWLAL
jgi:hypothetical protein